MMTGAFGCRRAAGGVHAARAEEAEVRYTNDTIQGVCPDLTNVSMSSQGVDISVCLQIGGGEHICLYNVHIYTHTYICIYIYIHIYIYMYMHASCQKCMPWLTRFWELPGITRPWFPKAVDEGLPKKGIFLTRLLSGGSLRGGLAVGLLDEGHMVPPCCLGSTKPQDFESRFWAPDPWQLRRGCTF